MFLFDWFYGILTSLGLWQKEAKILLLGLDKFGKRVLLHKLKGFSSTPPSPEELLNILRNEVDNDDILRLPQQLYLPTQSRTSEELSLGKINFKVFDLGSQQHALRVLRDYDAKMDAVVYVVNALDRSGRPESKRELDALRSDESLANVPFLILANAPSPIFDELSLHDDLGLTNLTTGRGIVNLDANVRPLEFFICSNFRDQLDGFVWLSRYIN